MNQTSPEQDPYDWLRLVRLSGVEGRRWAEEYSSNEPLVELSFRSLVHFRHRRFDEGQELLSKLGGELRAAAGMDPSVRAVMERWYYGVLGYYFYSLDAFDQAEAAMQQAHAAIAAAIGERRFLVALADHCPEFRLHRARIARNRRRWDEMRSHVEEVRGMMEGRTPFCVLCDGTAVRTSTIREFYRAVLDPAGAEPGPLPVVLDDATRLRDFERFVHAMYRLPGFVIPYP